MKINPIGIGLVILGGAQMILQQYQDEKTRQDLKKEIKEELRNEWNQNEESE